MRPTARRTVAVGAAALVAVAAVALVAGAVRPEAPAATSGAAGADATVRMQDAAATLAAGTRASAVPATTSYTTNGPPYCYAPTSRVVALGCLYGPDRAGKRVAIVADSHTWAWWPAVMQAASAQRMRVGIFVKSGCGAVEVTRLFPFPTGLRSYTECEVWQRNAFAAVRAFRPDAVILASATNAWLPTTNRNLTNLADQRDRDARWRVGMIAAVSRYRTITARVSWLVDATTTTQAAITCASKPGATGALCGVPRRFGVAQGRSVEIATARALRIPVLDATPILCTATWCPALLDGLVVHRNAGHLSYDWAGNARPAFRFWVANLRTATTWR